MAILFRPLAILRSFSWTGFALFVVFVAAYTVWTWCGVLLVDKELDMMEQWEYLVSLFQRMILNFFPGYFLIALADGLPVRGGKRVAALTAALVVGIALTVQVRCVVANQKFYAYEARVLPYCTTFPTWRTYIDFSGSWITPMTIMGLAMIFIFTRRRDRQLVALLHNARATELEARRQRIESEIEAMQSRVDPDKLLETLRSIRARYETSLAEGETMLESLIVELRRAAGHPQPEAAD